MASSPIRYDRLMKEIPKHKSVTAALLASGFSVHTSQTQQKRVMQSALKYQAQKILDTANGTVKTKQLMSEIVGISKENLFDLLRKIANNDKDYGTALKVIAPLAKEHGIALAQDEGVNVQVPILNVTVSKPIDEQVLNDGSVEPPMDMVP